MSQTRPSQRPHVSDRASPSVSPKSSSWGPSTSTPSSGSRGCLRPVKRCWGSAPPSTSAGRFESGGGRRAPRSTRGARGCGRRRRRRARGARSVGGRGHRPGGARRTIGCLTGAAVVQVDDSGENCITVLAGANGDLDAAAVRTAADDLRRALVTVVQLEIPDAAVAEAIALAGGTVVLNPSPARPVAADVLGRVDVLIVNRSELALLAGEAEPATSCRRRGWRAGSPDQRPSWSPSAPTARCWCGRRGHRGTGGSRRAGRRSDRGR